MADPLVSPRRASPPFVGREREQGALREVLQAALAGRGSLVLLGGEAGIGKTALAETVLTRAEACGATVLIGRCYDLSETPPYGPWAEALGRLPRTDSLPVLRDLGDGGEVASQAVLFARVREALSAAAARAPVVALLDDLHWADHASIELLRAVGRGIADLPVLLLVTYRGDELPGRHPLSVVLPAMVRECRPLRLALRALDEIAVGALVRERYALAPGDEDRLVAYLAGRGEGNPFFLGELLQTLTDEGILRRVGDRWVLGDPGRIGVPTLVRQVIEGRLGRLEERDRRLLATAATIGQVVPLDLWATAAAATEEALLATIERAAALRLLEATALGADARFVHALTREAVYAGILPPRRREAHRRIAEVLVAARADAAPDPDAVAYHLHRAGDPRAAHWLVLAGERAQRACAWHTASERYEAALALLGDASANRQARARLVLALALLRRHAEPGRGDPLAGEAVTLADAAGSAALAALARFERGHLQCLAGDFPGGLAAMADVLPTLEALAPDPDGQLPGLLPHGPIPGEAYHRGVLMLQLARTGHFARVLELGQRPDGRGRQLATPGHLALACARAALGHPEEARGDFARARAAYQEQGQYAELAMASYWELEFAVFPYRADRPAERRRLAEIAVSAWDRARGTGVEHPGNGQLLLVEGRWADLDARRWNAGTLSYYDAAVARERGEHARAWAEVERSLPHGRATEPGSTTYFGVLAFQCLAARLCLDEADLASARTWLSACDRWLAWARSERGCATVARHWSAYYQAAGDLLAARTEAARALRHATAPRQPLELLATHRLLGELAIAAGEYGAASAHIESALALADACAAPYERALTLLAHGGLHAATGDASAATVALDAARQLLMPLRAKPALARVEQLSERRSAGPARARVTGILTTREAEVLRHIAGGGSNREIAAALAISERTVGRHIENLYRKIDATNKAEATAWAIRHGLA